MRNVLAFLVLAALSVAAAWYIAALPGTLTADVAGTSVSTSAPVALVLLAALFAVLYVIIRLLALLFRSPRMVARANRQRRRRQGDRAVTTALTALAANDPPAALREAERTRTLLGDTPLTLLLHAQALRLAGRDGDADSAFRLLADREDGAFLGLRGLLRQAMAREDWAAAAALAQRADTAYPGAAWLRQERRELALRTGDWRDALRLSGPDTRAALAVAAADNERDPDAALSLSKQAWTADPTLPVAAVAYARRLRSAGEDRKAQDVLKKSWARSPHPDVALCYLHPIADRLQRYKASATLARVNPEHGDSHLLQATMALEAGLTGEARRHAEAARRAGLDQRRLWSLMEQIEHLDGRPDGVAEAQRRRDLAGPDPLWRCGHCGTVHQSWLPVCDACGTAGHVAWVVPAREQPQRSNALLPRPAAQPVQAIEGVVS